MSTKNSYTSKKSVPLQKISAMGKIKGRTEIAELGEFGLIDYLTEPFKSNRKTTIKGVGDDAAVIEASKSTAMLVSTDTMVEGIDFDLTYFPPKHLGYKAVTKGIHSNNVANALCHSLITQVLWREIC